MPITPIDDQHASAHSRSSEFQTTIYSGIQKFFSGDSHAKIRADIEALRDTTVTESYSELDKEDKWLLIEFIQRLSALVDIAHLLHSTPYKLLLCAETNPAS